MTRMFGFASVCGVALILAHAAVGGISVSWDPPVDLGPGGYARVHALQDGRLMAAYSTRTGIVARFSHGNAAEWSAPVAVAHNFAATNGAVSGRVFLANAEFAQLSTGRILYACNLRPAGNRIGVHPFAIGIATSDDSGKTWSRLKTVYAPKPAVPDDGRPHGCYEPFVLPLGGNGVRIYFADETPYAEARCAWQNISFIESDDGGETWGAPEIASYAPERRDGMPSVLELGAWRYMAIESNPGKTRLHPQIVRMPVSAERSAPVSAPSPDRIDIAPEDRDWTRLYGGAPYIAATENHILLSWQETDGTGNLRVEKPVARVAVLPKRSNGAGASGWSVFTPPGADGNADGMLWNSLCPLGGDAFLLVSQTGGRIVLRKGVLSVEPVAKPGSVAREVAMRDVDPAGTRVPRVRGHAGRVPLPDVR